MNNKLEEEKDNQSISNRIVIIFIVIAILACFADNIMLGCNGQ